VEVAVAVEFRLLGDVEARIDGHLVVLGPARRRCVLAVLLVEANRSVTVDQLADRIWADRPPQRAREVLHSYVSRLRQTLAAADDVRVGRQAGGYTLAVDPAAVDLHRFHELTTRAYAADDEAAEAMFDEALGLWRGPPFATLDTPWLNSVRDDLERRRLAVELDRNDLALRRGDHGRLLVDLTATAAANPLDERLAGQLMLALYRSGRQGDALDAYQQMRRRLADDLGADPGPPLRRLHQQILTADPTLTAPTRVARPGPESTHRAPRQLPAPPRSFTGRSDELAQLDAALTPAGGPPAVVVSALSGTAGIGKTALALHWAHRVAGQFPDGQLYVNLRGFEPTGSAMDPAEAVRGFLHALHVPPHRIPPSVDAQAALYRSQLTDKQILVVLDNARDAEQVRPLLPGSSRCLVVVTSRNQLTSLAATDGAQPVTLDLLPVDEARHLLAGRLGADRLAAEPDAVHDIIASCAGLPLALAIVAARAAAHPHFPLTAVARELRDANDRLDALADTDPATDIRAALSSSYRTLTPAATRLFRLLGLHPGPDLAAPAAASLAGVPIGQARLLLAELARANLVTEHAPGRFTFHDLLRAYAARLVRTHDTEDERHVAVQRVLDHYVHTAHAATRLLDPHRDPITAVPARAGVIPERLTAYGQAMAWFTAERPVLLAAIDQAAASGFDTHTWQLAWTLTTFLQRRGYWHDFAATQHAALEAARRLADRPGQAHAHRVLAGAYTSLGRLDDAHTHLRHALDLHGALGDHTGQAYAHQNLARVFELQARHREALDHAVRALDLYRRAGHRAGQARALNAVGWYHARNGDHQRALSCCQQALGLFRELGNQLGEANTWDSLGFAHHHLGQYAEAIDCYLRAVDLFRELGDSYQEAATLTNLGDTHQAAGDPAPARDAWRLAITIFDELGRPDADEVRTKVNGAAAWSRPILAE
jgi:DNA-binding SARP family transcriptional activator/tetratricopeptide (TPR) repeat protein